MLHNALRSFALLALALSPLFTSCAAPKGHERAENLAATMTQLEGVLATCKSDVDATRVALNAVEEQAEVDPKPSYDKFVAAFKALQSSSGRVADTSARVIERGNAFLSNWERRAAAIVDEDVRKGDAGRRAKLAEALREVSASCAAVAKELDPLEALLTDLRAALDNDLTPAGIDAMSSPISRAVKGAGKAIGAIDDALETLADVKVQFQTAKPPADAPAK